MSKKTWLITGISSGLGKALANAVTEHGDFVIGTIRQDTDIKIFNEQFKGKGFALKLDLSKEKEIVEVSDFIKEKFPHIDVIVNNAGYGLAGAIEETTSAEARHIFETNFFGPLRLTQSLLPLLRAKRSGHIVQISSHGGVKAFAGFGIYNASKFALEGMSEALAAEVGPLGINVTIVEPGPFRTNFAGQSFKNSQRSISDYAETAGTFRQRIANVHGKQEGDPEKAAKAILALAYTENISLRLPLGKVALASIEGKIKSLSDDVAATRAIAEQAIYN